MQRGRPKKKDPVIEAIIPSPPPDPPRNSYKRPTEAEVPLDDMDMDPTGAAEMKDINTLLREQRGLLRLATAQNQRNHHVFIEEISRHPEFVNCLSIGNEKIQKFLEAMTSNSFIGKTVTEIARKCKISPTELADLWRHYHLSKAMLIITEGIPQAATRMVQDAVGGKIVCPHCDGRTTVTMEEPDVDDPLNEELVTHKLIPCPNCDGEGVIWKPGHEHSRDRMLEITGMVKKSGGGIHVHNNIVQPQGVESVIEELERKSRNHQSTKTVEAEFEEVAEGTAE